jgi:hypothetical protein
VTGLSDQRGASLGYRFGRTGNSSGYPHRHFVPGGRGRTTRAANWRICWQLYWQPSAGCRAWYTWRPFDFSHFAFSSNSTSKLYRVNDTWAQQRRLHCLPHFYISVINRGRNWSHIRRVQPNPTVGLLSAINRGGAAGRAERHLTWVPSMQWVVSLGATDPPRYSSVGLCYRHSTAVVPDVKRG